MRVQQPVSASASAAPVGSEHFRIAKLAVCNNRQSNAIGDSGHASGGGAGVSLSFHLLNHPSTRDGPGGGGEAGAGVVEHAPLNERRRRRRRKQGR